MGIHKLIPMKTTLSLTFATAAIGAVLVVLANASFIAALPAEILFAAAISVALVGITIADYKRNVRPLTIKAPVSRVVAAPAHFAPRSHAYGIRRTSAVVERTAA